MLAFCYGTNQTTPGIWQMERAKKDSRNQNASPLGLTSMETKNIHPSTGSERETPECQRLLVQAVPRAKLCTPCIFSILISVLLIFNWLSIALFAMLSQAIPSSEEERCAMRGVGSSIERHVGSLPESAAEMLGPTPRRVGGANGARAEPEPGTAPAAADRRTDWRPSRDCCSDLLGTKQE